MVDDLVDLLVGKQALVQALVQEVVVQDYDLVDGLHLSQVLFELLEVGLKHFEEHVVQVVLTELNHLMPGSARLREKTLDVALFGCLVDAPRLLEACLNVLLKQQVSENKLVLVQRIL